MRGKTKTKKCFSSMSRTHSAFSRKGSKPKSGGWHFLFSFHVLCAPLRKGKSWQHLLPVGSNLTYENSVFQYHGDSLLLSWCCRPKKSDNEESESIDIYNTENWTQSTMHWIQKPKRKSTQLWGMTQGTPDLQGNSALELRFSKCQSTGDKTLD